MRDLRSGFGLPRPTSAVAVCLFGLGLACILPTSTQTAIANGDTRVLNLHHAHTGEQISIAFRVNGSYDHAALAKLNWFLRDWRNDATTKMDPRLFDVIWEAQRGAGSSAPLRVMSAYRSPETNSMLRRRSRGVAEFSQHTRGKAMDLHIPDAPLARVREVAMRMQRGGVGYYPANGFVHLDVGGVRAWPRMTYDQLARLFPDGKTVHLPTNGQPLARYEEARAEIAARGDYSMPTVAQVQSKGFFASLFGWGEDEDEAPTPVRGRGRAAPVQTAAYAPTGGDDSAAAFFRADSAGWASPRRTPAPAIVAAPAPAPVAAPVLAPAPAPAPVLAPAPVAPVIVAASNAPAWMKSLDAAPVPPRRPDVAPIAVASLAPAPVALPAPAFDAPLPPRRPAEFSVAQVEPPKPPVRVAETPGLPAMIVEGAAGAAAPGVLAYAAAGSELTAAPRPAARAAQRQPVSPQAAARARKSVLVAARLDASSFSTMTAPASVADHPISAQAAPPARKQAARAEAVAMMFGAPVLDARFHTGFQPTSAQP